MRCFALALVVAGVTLAGCASTSDAVNDASEVVSCSKCETVWVRHGSRHPKRSTRVFHFKREMACADCEAMACAYLEEGAAFKECPKCKVKPTVAKAKRPAHRRVIGQKP